MPCSMMRMGNALRGVVETKVKVGDRVEAAQVLGMLGSARLWESPHLHFELHLDGRPQDPCFGVAIWPPMRRSPGLDSAS